jgi:adenylyl- and sulfurtransferase ThiI
MNGLYIVANFGEIFLKGRNISFFEKRLLRNLKESLGVLVEKVTFKKVSGGAFYIKLDKSLKENEILKIEESVKNTLGFVSYYRAYFVKSDLEELKKLGKILAKEELNKNKNIKTFAVSSDRAEKRAPFGSKESNIEVGSAI